MNLDRPELAERLAAEYVAGTLRGRARRRFEAMLPSHPELRRAVQDWQDRLLPLTAALDEVAPPARVWPYIEARLTDAGGATVAPVWTGAGRGWWQNLAFWRGLAGVSSLVALVLALLLANPTPQAPVVVVLASTATDGGAPAQAGFVASVSADGRAVATRPLMPVSLAAGRALELWAVPATGAPRSLGLISADGASVVRRRRLPDDTAALAVSLEPAAGSPTGAPTGPILYVGKLTL